MLENAIGIALPHSIAKIPQETTKFAPFIPGGGGSVKRLKMEKKSEWDNEGQSGTRTEMLFSLADHHNSSSTRITECKCPTALDGEGGAGGGHENKGNSRIKGFVLQLEMHGPADGTIGVDKFFLFNLHCPIIKIEAVKGLLESNN